MDRGQEEIEVKVLIPLLPPCWAMGCLHPSVTGHHSSLMILLQLPNPSGNCPLAGSLSLGAAMAPC